jgi:hypothetical protein
VYRVCWSTSSTACASSFSAMATTAAGAVSYTLTGLTGGSTYHVVVRAVDGSGNSDTNTVTRSAMTGNDSLPPTFAGAGTVTSTSSTQALVAWTAATDDFSPASAITYQVCWGTTMAACTSAFGAMLTTAPGATSATLNGLVPSTTYYVVVRARDAAGNVDTNTVVRNGSTSMDSTPPTFNGAVGVTAVYADTVASSGQLTVTWPAATDDAWGPSSLRYQLCWNSSPSSCTGAAFIAMATTAAGATTYTVSSLTSNTAYSVFVRAMDGSNNVETGNHSAMGTTAVSYSTSIGTGIFNVSNAVGGCNGGCHFPLWNYTNTNNVTVPGCAGFWFVRPSFPSQSLVYLKMAGLQSMACGGNQMPNGGPYDQTKIGLMNTWISQGAHNN